ncbi:MAG TPA: hypothetical protein DD666_18590 [Advenella kashmirensis]|uniref:Uncharacterized protein n=1 Tax=Advenella kashmirensis TaxID=310575 RepID=A0A356LK45_9BURK|nr:hypothetical protein [Advenella kashmirensis]
MDVAQSFGVLIMPAYAGADGVPIPALQIWLCFPYLILSGLQFVTLHNIKLSGTLAATAMSFHQDILYTF